MKVTLLAVGVLSLLVLGGCQPEKDPFLDLVDAQKGTQQGNDLERTMSLAMSDASYNYRQYEEKISGGLNRWIRRVLVEGGEAADDSQQWKSEPLVLPLVEKYRDVPAVAAHAEREFVSTDPYFIRERSWLKLIADRVCRSSKLSTLELMRLQAGDFLSDVRALATDTIDTSGGGIDETRQRTEDSQNQKYIRELMVRLNPELDPEDADRLGDAILLFDWVTRNIQLEDPLDPADDKVDDYRLVPDSSLERASAGIPGLGYRRFIWQILVYGRGDYVEKARIFSGLCRQQGIESVLLLTDGKPWLVAVLIGGRAWLFDTRLGLPVPGEKPGQVATLEQVRANGRLLESLDLTVDETNRDDSRYWVRPGDLESLSAAVFATPESVSRRMAFLQNRLLGEQRLVLMDDVAATAEIAARVLPGVPLSVSPFAFQTHSFRKVVGESLKRALIDDVLASKLTWYYTEEDYIDQFVDYRSARNLFFIGRFETERNSRKLSAVQGFYSLLYPDEIITNIGTDSARLNRLGIYQERGQNATAFEQRLQGVQHNMRLVRRDVGVFLAQSHFDNGNVSSAGNWMQKVLERDDTSRWTPVIKYIWGRSFESTGDYDRAIALYRESAGAQFLGDYLRARLLKQAMDAAGLKPAVPVTTESGEPGAGEKVPASDGTAPPAGGDGSGNESGDGTGPGGGGEMPPVDG